MVRSHLPRAGGFVPRPLPAMDVFVVVILPKRSPVFKKTHCFCVTEVFNKKHFAL